MSNRSITVAERIVRWTPQFAKWFSSLKDQSTKVRLLRRLRRLQQGLYGDVLSVGDGVFEMREFFGPGWRMYYIEHKECTVIMLVGGDKSTQVTDIRIAKNLAATLED